MVRWKGRIHGLRDLQIDGSTHKLSDVNPSDSWYCMQELRRLTVIDLSALPGRLVAILGHRHIVILGLGIVLGAVLPDVLVILHGALFGAL